MTNSIMFKMKFKGEKVNKPLFLIVCVIIDINYLCNCSITMNLEFDDTISNLTYPMLFFYKSQEAKNNSPVSVAAATIL